MTKATLIPYTSTPTSVLHVEGREISSFTKGASLNADQGVLESFGDEWTRFQTFSPDDIRTAGDQYFDIVTASMLGQAHVVLDIGCGTGRWSKYLSPRVGFIEAVDPSDAVRAAVRLTSDCQNIRVTQAGHGSLPFPPASFDFVLSLGVVHHLPDTEAAIAEAATMLKPGGHLLLYVYYDLAGRSRTYKALFRLADIARRQIARLPPTAKAAACDMVALIAYLPTVLFARFARTLLGAGRLWRGLPLAYYSDKSWFLMRSDSRDRFGTLLEKRFGRSAIEAMLHRCRLKNIHFSDSAPFWHVVAQK